MAWDRITILFILHTTSKLSGGGIKMAKKCKDCKHPYCTYAGTTASAQVGCSTATFNFRIITPFGKQHVINALRSMATNIEHGIIREGSSGTRSGSGHEYWEWK